MKKNVKILELGASSLLDFDFTQDEDIVIEWIKTYNKNKPKYSSSLIPIRTIRSLPSCLDRAMMGTDVIILSVGNKGEQRKFHEYSTNDIHELIESNFIIPTDLIKKVITYRLMKSHRSPLRIIFLNSVSGRDGASYENHSVYAAMKAAMSSLVRTMIEEYDPNQLKFIDLKIPYTKSRMSGSKGESPDNLRSLIMDLIKAQPNVNLSEW